MKYLLKYVAIATMGLFFTGCVQHNFNVQMPQNYKPQKQFDYHLSKVDTKYGTESERRGDMDLESANFLGSLKNSVYKAMDDSRVFNLDSKNDIVLELKVIENDAPSFGTSMTVDTSIEYTIYSSNNEVIYKNIITSKGTAGAFERFAGLERVYLANDRAIHNNIKSFLNDLSFKLKEPKKEVVEEKVAKKDNKAQNKQSWR